MQALKALVIGMGILIIAGMAILVYGLTGKVGTSLSSKTSAAAFGTVRANLPAGASVDTVHVEDGNAVVHLVLPDGGAQIMVFRLSDGRQTGTIELLPQR